MTTYDFDITTAELDLSGVTFSYVATLFTDNL